MSVGSAGVAHRSPVSYVEVSNIDLVLLSLVAGQQHGVALSITPISSQIFCFRFR